MLNHGHGVPAADEPLKCITPLEVLGPTRSVFAQSCQRVIRPHDPIRSGTRSAASIPCNSPLGTTFNARSARGASIVLMPVQESISVVASRRLPIQPRRHASRPASASRAAGGSRPVLVKSETRKAKGRQAVFRISCRLDPSRVRSIMPRNTRAGKHEQTHIPSLPSEGLADCTRNRQICRFGSGYRQRIHPLLYRRTASRRYSPLPCRSARPLPAHGRPRQGGRRTPMGGIGNGRASPPVIGSAAAGCGSPRR